MLSFRLLAISYQEFELLGLESRDCLGHLRRSIFKLKLAFLQGLDWDKAGRRVHGSGHGDSNVEFYQIHSSLCEPWQGKEW